MSKRKAHPGSGLVVGLVHNWPGKRNSELDLIVRIAGVLSDQGEQAQVIDPLGNLLDLAGNPLDAQVDEAGLDLVLNLHYTNPKWLDALSYVVNWNPLEYIVDDPFTGSPVSEPHLFYLMDCLRSHDRVLSGGSPLLDYFAERARGQHNRQRVADDLSPPLHTTIPAAMIGNRRGFVAPVDSQSFKVFYIGTNWEKTSRSRRTRVRHKGLFERLGETGQFRFFGLKKQNGVDLWKGVAGYQGELPFDGGRSIIDETRRAGVALVPSSPQHLRSGLVSTRIFQACAAGSIIISDRNPFVEKHFGDCVRYFDYGETSAQTATSILRQVDWVRQHWDEAVAMAERAQTVFLERFSMEAEVAEICRVARSDLARRRRREEARKGHLVCVHYLMRRFDEKELQRCIANLEGQTHENIELMLYTLPEYAQQCREGLREQTSLSFVVRVCSPLELRIGESLSGALQTPADFHLWYSEGFTWSSAHLANLLEMCSDAAAGATYSPFFADFEELRVDGEMIRYFIKGLDGGFDRVSERGLRALDNTRLPVGNVLIAKALLQQTSLDALRMFDCLAVFMLLRTAMEEDLEAISFSPVITTRFRKTRGCALNLRYSEYDYFPPPWSLGRRRDLQLERGFARGAAIVHAGSEELTVDELHRKFSVLEFLKHRAGVDSIGGRLVSFIGRSLSRVR